MNNCPSCGQPMYLSARFCTNCGASVPTAALRLSTLAQDRYRVLLVFSIILQVLAWVGAVAMLLGTIINSSKISHLSGGSVGPAAFFIFGVLGAVMYWLVLCATAEMIVLMINLESHACSIRRMMEQDRIPAQTTTGD